MSMHNGYPHSTEDPSYSTTYDANQSYHESHYYPTTEAGYTAQHASAEPSHWSVDDHSRDPEGWTTTHYTDGDTDVIKQTYSNTESSNNAWTDYHPSEEGEYSAQWHDQTVTTRYDEERQYETSTSAAPLQDWTGVQVGAEAPPAAAAALHELLPGSQAPEVVHADTSTTVGPDGKKVTKVSYTARANW